MHSLGNYQIAGFDKKLCERLGQDFVLYRFTLKIAKKLN